MRVRFDDYTDLGKIQRSGQCFRVRTMEDGAYRFITGGEVVYIRELDNHEMEVSCGAGEWSALWEPYFDIATHYDKVIEDAYGKHPFIDRAIDCGRGLRVLRQEPWEMLVTFIISQRKSIPAIAGAVEALCKKYGSRLDTEYETIYTFPTPEQMAGATNGKLRECSLGYRAPYVLDAIERVTRGDIDLDALFDYDDETLLTELMRVHGVGKKVANCVALFAYGRLGCVPIDVHIAEAIERDCGGCSPFDLYGDAAGIMQQYVFYYEKNRG